MHLKSNHLGSFDHGITIGESIQFSLDVAGLLHGLDRSERVFSDLITQGVELNANLPAKPVVPLKREEAIRGTGEQSSGGGCAQEGASSHGQTGEHEHRSWDKKECVPGPAWNSQGVQKNPLLINKPLETWIENLSNERLTKGYDLIRP